MERKIGEIFKYNGEWYQCVKSDGTCNGCVGKFQPYSFCNGFKECAGKIFKKLEKVGEPFIGKVHTQLQRYKIYTKAIIDPIENVYINGENTVVIEIKQNKEDMEEKKQKIDDLLGLYSSDKITYKELDKELKALYDKEESEPTLKEFDIEAAKQGRPVCTRDGRKARIICFDAKGDFPIVALVETNNIEEVYQYTNNGLFFHLESNDLERVDDLMMLPEKKEGWAVIRRSDIYETEEQAKEVLLNSRVGVMIRKIEWEE